MRFFTLAPMVILLIGMATGARAQDAAVMSDAEINKEAATAQSLYSAGNTIGALPLYEDLHRRQPQSNVYRERLAMALLAKAGDEPAADAKATRQRARQLLLDAKAAGDNSNLLQVVLEKLDTPEGASAETPSPGTAALQRAEKAFSTGDLAGAMKLYIEAAAADPKMYEAPLFAGDAEYKQGHYAEAGKWFAQAIAINPDRETAYRYWGDSLMKQGDPSQAKSKFIDAIVAEPYARAPRIGLKQWADGNHALVIPPAITLPARAAVDDKGRVEINIDPAQTGSPMLPADIAYTMGSTVWRSSMFQKTYPAETKYRHSLGEEAQSIRVALSTLAKVAPEKMDATWSTLAKLDKDGMLECWILLDHPDQGIAYDYAAYRATHRDLLRAYMAKYDIHPQ